MALACPTVAELKCWGREHVTALHLDSLTELQVVSLLELVRKQDGLAQRIEGAVLKSVKPAALQREEEWPKQPPTGIWLARMRRRRCMRSGAIRALRRGMSAGSGGPASADGGGDECPGVQAGQGRLARDAGQGF